MSEILSGTCEIRYEVGHAMMQTFGHSLERVQ